MIEKIRYLADMGRAQGITTSASVAIVGALTSTGRFEWYHAVYFTILVGIVHMVLTAYKGIYDSELDSTTYTPSKNPITIGVISKKEVSTFVYGATIISTFLVLMLFLYLSFTSALLSLFCFIISFLVLIWYAWKGKKYVISYDFSFSISYAFTVLFGVYAIGGMPTVYTWIFIGIVIFAATSFAQWGNSLKDADADRNAGIRSLAVISGVKNNEKLHFTHPYFLYGISLKTFFILFCFLGFLQYQNIFYLLFIIIYGIPSQAFVMYRFLTKEKPVDHRNTILIDVAFAAILGYSIIIGKTGIIPILLLIIYLICGYFVGSAIQSQCEFKFGRFSKQT